MAAVAERRFLHTFTRGSHEGRDREEAAPPMRETELTGATVVVADVDVAAATAVAETATKQEQRRAPSFLTVTISFLPVALAADRCFE